MNLDSMLLINEAIGTVSFKLHNDLAGRQNTEPVISIS